ncbi:IclR family transcriptional regulator [Sphaerisporangium sp. NPDC051011]|uniref:IclR family transcriptional regulator n=1 Tax=Sphaerisporangium sp. NPDC051011 TaxID=3155792 RepID=UPI0033C81043
MEVDFRQAQAGDGRSSGVRAVTRALGLLSALGREGRTLTEMAASIDVSLSTASRLLATLKMAGYVDQSPDGLWHPGMALTTMLYQTDQWACIRSIAGQAARGLRDELNETVAFFVLAGAERLCIESAESERPVRRVVPPGERGPAHLGAAGKALLAFSGGDPEHLGSHAADGTFLTATGRTRTWDELRAELAEIAVQGYAYSSYESTHESWSVAAPVRVSERVVGVLATVVPATRNDPDYIAHITQRTIAATRGIA